MYIERSTLHEVPSSMKRIQHSGAGERPAWRLSRLASCSMPSHPIPAISFAPRSVRSGCLIDGGTSPVATRCPGNELTLVGCVLREQKALAPCSRISLAGHVLERYTLARC